MKNLKITVNGVTYDVQVEEADGSSVSAPVAVSAPAAPKAAAKPSAAASGEPVKSPMPGTILDIKVKVGQAVKAGDVLVILEAMKMENEIKAAKDGTITSVDVSKSESVDTGAVLVTIG